MRPFWKPLWIPAAAILTWLILTAFQTAAPSVITITLLAGNGQPLPGVEVTLTLYRYTTWIEPVPGGSCLTGAAGRCQLAIADAPRLANGRAEGQLAFDGFAFQPVIGWQGETAAFVFTANDLELAASFADPEISPGEGEGYAGQQRTPTPPPTLTPGPDGTVSAPVETPPTLTPATAATVARFWDGAAWFLGGLGLLIGLILMFTKRRRPNA